MSKLNYAKVRTERLISSAKQDAGLREYNRIKAIYEELKAKKKENRLELIKQAYSRVKNQT